MISIPKWLTARTSFPAMVVGAALLVAVGIYARCRPPDPPEKVETRSETKKDIQATKAAQTRKEIAKRVRQVKEDYRPDGTVASRTTTDEATDAREDRKEAANASTSETTKTFTITLNRKPPKLGVSAQAMWDRVQLRPADITVSADIPVGKVLGLPVRLGPAVRFTPGDPKPDAYGVVLRAELP